MPRAILGMGANLAERENNISAAIRSLELLPMCTVLRISSLYETKPVGVKDTQPDYINCVVEVETDLSPRALLGACLGIEAALGRERIYDKAPRVIDIDLILYEGETLHTAELTVPHPAMRERAFVLRPLSELYPDLLVYGESYAADLDKLGEQRIKRVEK